jgi:hypothetical protein
MWEFVIGGMAFMLDKWVGLPARLRRVDPLRMPLRPNTAYGGCGCWRPGTSGISAVVHLTSWVL